MPLALKIFIVLAVWALLISIQVGFAYLFGVLATWITGVETVGGVYLPHLFVIVGLLFAVVKTRVSSA